MSKPLSTKDSDKLCFCKVENVQNGGFGSRNFLPLIGRELARMHMQMHKLARLEGPILRISFLSALDRGQLATIGSR